MREYWAAVSRRLGEATFDVLFVALISLAPLLLGRLAATRLAAIAFDRALHGRSERFYRDGELVMERKMPSDYLLTWLLSRLDPLQFGSPSAKALAAATGDPRERSRNSLPGLVESLVDIAADDCPVESAEAIDERLGEMS